MAATDVEGRQLHDRALRLFEYLKRLAELRTPTVRDVGEYPRVLWFDDIPQERECRVVTAGQPRGQSEWIEVDRVAIPARPELPRELTPWVDKAELHDPDGTPELRAVADDGDDRGVEPRWSVDHDPEILARWRQYKASWDVWAAEARRRKTVQATYLQLFDLHDASTQRGEQYETVVGVGLLDWPSRSGRVRRHLLTMPAAVRFDAESGRITVGPPEDVRLSLEEDMLDDAPASPDVVRDIEERLNLLEGDPWDQDELAGVLTAWMHAAHATGSYDHALSPPREAGPQPGVTFAPALILRRRTQRSLLKFCEDVVQQLREGLAGVPPSVAGLLVPPQLLREWDAADTSGSGGPPTEVFFPLPANTQQRQIVERLTGNRGVVVQGPPGTGKSHTIANLLSHLTATGQRVLVTSHTARALEVLTDKLPDDVRRLCVTVLGEGRRGTGDLERSLQTLLARSTDPDWEERAVAGRVTTLRRSLEEAAEEHRELLSRQRAIRERELGQHRLPFGGYEGTLARIAERLGQEEAHFGWLRDRANVTAPLSNTEALRTLELLRRLDGGGERRALQVLPDPALVLSPEAAGEHLTRLDAAERDVGRLADARAHSAYTPLSQASGADLDALRAALAALTHARDLALRQREPWIADAIRDVLDGRADDLADIEATTTAVLAELDPYVRRADSVNVTGLDRLPRPLARQQVIGLRAHLEGGGRLRGPIKAAPVRAARTLLEQVRVGGLVPDTVPLLDDLLAVIDARDGLEWAERRWSGRLRSSEGLTFAARYHQLADAAGLLRGVLALRPKVAQAEQAAWAVAGLVPPLWSDAAQVGVLQRCLELVWAERDAAVARQALQGAIRALRTAGSGPDAAPESLEAADALLGRDVAAYAGALNRMQEIQRRRAEVDERDDLLIQLATAAPELAAELRATPADTAWDERLRGLDRAWDWARADAWYRGLMNAGEERTVADHLRACEERTLKLTEHLSANLAWWHCLQRMTPEQRQELYAYRSAMRRYGKGTGRHAPRHLADARRHLRACQDAVPVWVMPTYRVSDMIAAQPGTFDVVIVDEASQSGVEALFLLWLGKKVVIVGDDQQISPTLFLNRDTVQRYVNQYLYDFPQHDMFGVDSSLFDQAEVFLNEAPIRLREHFRCMPQIIAFSNSLSYSDNPLVPLREFGTDHLQPLRSVFVPGASTRGTTSKVNEDEARAVAEQVAKCCADPAYDGASMGVISLVGEAQAMRVRDLLIGIIGPEEMQARRLVCGDAYAFQGDERDVMFLSMVDVPEGGRWLRARTQKSDYQRFNVAASRARDQLWLFHSVQPQHLNPDCVRAKLLQHFLNPPPALDAPEIPGEVRPDVRCVPFDSLFEQRVYLKIRARGYNVVAQQQVHGYRIDLVVVGERSRLAVECDGDAWHGPEQYEQDMARQRDLERCGWRFFRIRESEFYRDPDTALAPLWTQLADRGIWPPGATPRPRDQPPQTVHPTPRPAAAHQASPTTVAEAIPRPGHRHLDGDRPDDDQPDAARWTGRDAADEEAPPQKARNLGAFDRGPAELDVAASQTFARRRAPELPELPRRPLAPAAPAGRATTDVGLAPYEHWKVTPQPDPREAPQQAIVDALVEVVAAEGPVVAQRAYLLLLHAAGFSFWRVGWQFSAPLHRAVDAAIQQGLITVDNPDGDRYRINRVLRLPGAPHVRLRLRGNRKLYEIPKNEIAELLRQLRRLNPALDDTALGLAALEIYRHRATDKASSYIDTCLRLLEREPTPREHPPAEEPQPPWNPGQARARDPAPEQPLDRTKETEELLRLLGVDDV